MRILGYFDRYAPPLGGGVVTTATILRELAKRGHEVVYLTEEPGANAILGARRFEAPSDGLVHKLYRWAEVIMPHRSATLAAIEYARATARPVIYPVYDDGQLDAFGLTPDDVELAVFCSTGLQERTQWPGRQLVLYPPVFIAEHQVDTTGDAITLASLSPEKGAELFWQLAERLPDRQFLGVIGGWGSQLVPEDIPRNVNVVEHQGNDLRAIFRQTRLLLLPSQRLGEGERYWTENWGRAAVEAAASGIPVIANPAPGPVEALAYAGIFRDRNDVEAWVDAIESLDNPDVYRRQSNLVRHRAEELEQIVDDQFAALDRAIRSISPRHPIEQEIDLLQAGEELAVPGDE